MINSALNFAFQNLLIVLALYITGTAILQYFKVLPSNKFSRQYLALLTGYLFTIGVTAIIYTNGATAYWALLPIIIYFQFTKGKRQNYSSRISTREHIQFLSIISFFAFLITFLLVYKYTGYISFGEFVPQIHNDYVFYANVASHVSVTGYENYQIHSSGTFLNLYHYSEMWLTVLSHLFSDVPYIQNFLWGAIPVIFTLVWYGFFALANLILPNKSSGFLLTISAICFIAAPFSGLVTPFASILKGDVYDLVFSNYYKLSLILLFILALVHIGKRIESAILILYALAIVYPTTLPAIIGTSGILLLYLFFFAEQRKALSLRLAALGLSIILVLAGLMILFPNTAIGNKSVTSASTITRYVGDVSNYIKTIVNIFGSSGLKILISCFPYILLGVLLYRKIESWILKLIYCGLFILQVIGLAAWAILLRMPDSVQLWFNLYLPIVSVIVFILILYAVSDQRKTVRLFGYVLIAANLFTHSPFHAEFHDASPEEKVIIEKVISNKNSAFVFIRDSSEYASVFDKNVSFGIIGSYISFFQKTYTPVCLNVHQIKIENEWEKEFVGASAFAKYCEGKNKPIEELQKEYIDEKKVLFFIASKKAVIPEFIATNNESIIEDSTNNIRVVTLRK